MKKMFLTVALTLATFGMAQANLQKNYDKLPKSEPTELEAVKNFVSMNDSTPFIIHFYDIERIEINNSANVHIKIYNERWEVIKETNDSVNMKVVPGNYYVASDKKIKHHYIQG